MKRFINTSSFQNVGGTIIQAQSLWCTQHCILLQMFTSNDIIGMKENSTFLSSHTGLLHSYISSMRVKMSHSLLAQMKVLYLLY
jgi:hypothetical protein